MRGSEIPGSLGGLAVLIQGQERKIRHVVAEIRRLKMGGREAGADVREGFGAFTSRQDVENRELEASPRVPGPSQTSPGNPSC
jgi:hypothetical protein